MIVVILIMVLLSACATAPAPAPAPAPEKKAAEPFRLTSVFPAGPGQEKVLSTCGSCHAVGCAALGKRTAANWDNVKKSHKDKMTQINAADLDAMFGYLASNFNDSKPEPVFPPELLAQGCTPF
ncbi:MAG: hypothetical protein FJW39_30045 [Acidobacteria bacterium]|nr:hypothetical protein [Acidobacteriota bacterium]